MDIGSKISFSFQETPKWRKIDRTTFSMLNDIARWRKAYVQEHRAAIQVFANKFALAMTVEYIQNLNSEEKIGTQTLEETFEVLKKVIENRVSEFFQGTKRMVTINTYKAMEKLFALHESGGKTGLLSVDQICDVHKILNDGHPIGGKIRKSMIHTHWNEEAKFSPPPDKIEGLFHALIDHHNVCIESSPSDTNSVEYLSCIFKCAAWLLFELEDTHPFETSNSRLGRLVANHIVNLTTPFPVNLHHKYGTRNQCCKDYINALVRCNEHQKEGPGELAAMLVEGAWHGWKKLMSELKQQLRPVPIVVRKSQCNEQYMFERISRIWSYFERQGVTKTKEEVCQTAVAAVLRTDILCLHPNQYLTISVSLVDKIELFMDITT